MVSERINRFRYRLNTRRYEMRRENALRMARMRYRLDNMAAGGFLKIALLVLLGATPFVLYFLLQPDTPTVAEDPVSTITRNLPPPAPLAFPSMSPTPSPTAVESPTSSPTPSPSPSPSLSPTAAQCSNGRDDDRDGRTDFPADRGCSSRADRSESPDPSPTPGAPPAPAPPAAPAPAPPPPPVSPSPPTSIVVPQCRDGLDNDGDGKIDWQDLGCTSNEDPDESGPVIPSPTPSPEPPTPTAPPATAPRLTEPLESLVPGTAGLLDPPPPAVQ